jgi:hypothetical protein
LIFAVLVACKNVCRGADGVLDAFRPTSHEFARNVNEGLGDKYQSPPLTRRAFLYHEDRMKRDFNPD